MNETELYQANRQAGTCLFTVMQRARQFNSIIALKHLMVIVTVFFSLSSCQISGLTSGYSHLSKEAKDKVIKYDGEINDISDYSNIYVVTPNQIKQYLSSHKDVIVYDYTPFCKSPNCISPINLFAICKDKDYDFLIIANMYDYVMEARNSSFPILMINTDSLESKMRGKYIDEFYSHLINKTSKEVDYASYHYFHNGEYVRSYKNPKEISASHTSIPQPY